MEEVKTETPSSSSSSSRSPSASSLRWAILRNTFRARPPRSSASDNPSAELRGGGAGAGAGKDIISISRRTTAQGFNLIPSCLIQSQQEEEKDCVNLSKTSNSNNKDHVYVSYTLPLHTLVLRQRLDNSISLSDFEICNKYHIDNTGLVCSWPSEDVLSYFCLSHANMFRSKRVLELGAGYGLAGLVIAASTDAIEVVISDGNPQVVDYIQHNIYANSTAFSGTEVKSMILHWNQEEFSNITNAFDIIVASDCTFFKEFHESLARTIKSSLKHSEASEAILLSPKRGNSLDKFLEKITEVGLHFSVVENYDEEIWQRHQKFVNGDCSWPNYETDHCYPFLVRITF